MATLDGTQEFMAVHHGHVLTVSEVCTIDRQGMAGVYRDDSGAWRVSMREIMETVPVETIGVYLYCTECAVECEINSGEYDND